MVSVHRGNCGEDARHIAHAWHETGAPPSGVYSHAAATQVPAAPYWVTQGCSTWLSGHSSANGGIVCASAREIIPTTPERLAKGTTHVNAARFRFGISDTQACPMPRWMPHKR